MPLPVSPFKPADGSTVNIAAVGVASASVLVATNANQDVQVRIVYPGTGAVFIKAGATNAVAATASDIALLGGSNEVLTFPSQPSGQLYLAAISAAAGAGAIYFTVGVGN